LFVEEHLQERIEVRFANIMSAKRRAMGLENLLRKILPSAYNISFAGGQLFSYGGVEVVRKYKQM